MNFFAGYKDKITSKPVKAIMLLLNFLFVPLFAAVIPDIVYRKGVSFDYFFGNIGLYFLVFIALLCVYFALTLLVKRVAISSFVFLLLSCIMSFVNQNKLNYRFEPFFISDIYHLFGAAETIDSGLKLSISAPLAICFTISIIISLLYIPIKMELITKKVWIIPCFAIKLVAAVGAVVLCGVYVRGVIFNEPLTEALGRVDHASITEQYDDNTFYFELIATTESSLFPKKPKGYAREQMSAIGEKIANESAAQAGRKVDVIVVQVETWFELKNYDVEIKNNPFDILDELKAEGVSGNMIPPKYGGGTAYIEYEVLTGFSSGDSQAAACPFNAYVYEDFPSAPQFYKRDGYSTVAVHAYNNTMYNRSNAYPMLGFDSVNFEDTFTNPTRSGEWIDDSACVKKTIELYNEEIQKNDHVFMHILTMQNHSPLYASRFSESELAAMGVTSGSLSAEQVEAVAAYAKAFERTNVAIKELTDYFSTVDRDVIIVVYGDHQASVCVEGQDSEILVDTGYFDGYVEELDFLETHSTPYLVWSNFDAGLGGTSFGNIAPNMLLVDALREYGVYRPKYFDYLYDNTLTTNGGTANFVVNKDGDVSFKPTEEQAAEQKTRRLIEYDVVFGKKYLSDYLK